MENGHRNSWFTNSKWWFSMAMLNYQRVILALNKNLEMAIFLRLPGLALLRPSRQTKHLEMGTLSHRNPIEIPSSSHNHPIIIHMHLVGGATTILKHISQLGRSIPYMKWNIKFMFETTNQALFSSKVIYPQIIIEMIKYDMIYSIISPTMTGKCPRDKT